MERHEAISAIVAKFFHESRDLNPYASAETMRSLDHVLRNSLADGLARAATAWRVLYQQQSRSAGVPTREHPELGRDAMADLRSSKRMADALSDWVSRIHALPAPANDRVYHRVRNNDQLLELLIAADYALATTAAAIDRLAERLTEATAPTLCTEFDEQLEALSRAIRERSRMLTAVP